MDIKKTFEKKKNYVFIPLIIVSVIMIFAIIGYFGSDTSNQDYSHFMDEIKSYIYRNGLNSSYISPLEDIFGRYSDSSSMGKGIAELINGVLVILILIISIIAIILNFVSLNRNKKIFAQIFLFIYIIVIGYLGLHGAILKVKKLN